MVITRTPYRISFFGGGTDFPEWYNTNGGAVLSTTIDKYCYLTVRYLPPFFEHKHRIVYSIVEDVKNIEEIRHPSVRECLKFMDIKEGVEIHHDGDLPARSGIGTSSAFTVGLLHALHTLLDKPASKMDIALEAIKVEQQLIKEKVGCQDQVASALGGLNLIEFKNSITVERLTPTLQLEDYLLLVFTGFQRTSSNIVDSYKPIPELDYMTQLVYEARKCISGRDILTFGRLLDATWQLKKKLSPRVTTSYIDFIYEVAISAGALGGKILGAGNGGFMLLFVEPERRANVIKALGELLIVPFKLETQGTTVLLK